MTELGLIEGFFGPPWSWPERAETIRFLAPHGYRFYLYAPKADSWLRRRWRERHPEAELAALVELASDCRAAGVRFGIGLTPFEAHLGDYDWRPFLADKLESLADLDVDDLAILFDDMRGDMPDLARRQAEIVAFAAERSGASRIFCCPSYYSDDSVLDRAFGKRPERYLEDLGLRLDPAVEIFWTGEEVCSREYSAGHLDRVAEKIGRRPFLWDNYPVNDGPRMSQHLHLRAFTGRLGLDAHIAGHGINVALQPVLGRIPALTLAWAYLGDYRYGEAFRGAARVVTTPELAERLEQDLLAFQDRGRDRLSAERRAELAAIYARFDHPAAREVIAWLEGHYDVSGESVETQ
jgi:hyaluronoglucosaminidase